MAVKDDDGTPDLDAVELSSFNQAGGELALVFNGFLYEKRMVYQAKAEARRAMAVAEEQEWRARTQQMRAKVVEAESQVPMALADALRSGNLGVMDYYYLKNVVADTDMRKGIADVTGKPSEDTDPDQGVPK